MVNFDFHGKSFDINYGALLGSAPTARATPVTIMPYYLYTTVRAGNSETSQCAPAPDGGRAHSEKRFSAEHE
jgi:hypothetical protein